MFRSDSVGLSVAVGGPAGSWRANFVFGVQVNLNTAKLWFRSCPVKNTKNARTFGVDVFAHASRHRCDFAPLYERADPRLFL